MAASPKACRIGPKTGRRNQREIVLKIIVITGASSGFGALTGRALAKAGHTMYASMRDTTEQNARQDKSKNGLYVFATVRTFAVKYAAELCEVLAKTDKRPVLVFLEIPTIRLFRNRSGVMANFSNSFSFNMIEGSGAPGEIRTPDPLLRRQTLYPTELRAHPWLLL
jgi:hypothetical protein